MDEAEPISDTLDQFISVATNAECKDMAGSTASDTATAHVSDSEVPKVKARAVSPTHRFNDRAMWLQSFIPVFQDNSGVKNCKLGEGSCAYIFFTLFTNYMIMNICEETYE